MNMLEENIKNIAGKIAEQNGFFLVDTVIRGNNNRRVIEIFIDGDNNVSADDCAKVSREINSEIENLASLSSSYRLDVSSPGIDRPLKFLKQFPKNINRNFEISYKTDEQTKKLTARLIKVEGEELVFLTKNKDEQIINFNNIKKAKVLVSFS